MEPPLLLHWPYFSHLAWGLGDELKKKPNTKNREILYLYGSSFMEMSIESALK